MTSSRGRGIAPGVVLMAVLSLLLAGCSVPGSGRSSPSPTASSTRSATASPTRAASMAEFYRQTLHWTKCRTGQQCADLWVPLDYAKPTGRAITLSLLKVPALEPSRRRGSMVVNPGGPGASGVDYAASAATTFGSALRRVYDVVGFDPRGVGRSTPVQCASDHFLNTVVDGDSAPTTTAERRAADRLVRTLGRGCLDRSGALARHVSTVEVAKDLDVLRAALGDRRLTYFGASYGTAIGATYADLFPRQVGRMVLDGALDPASSMLDIGLVQAHGFEVALRAYVGACVDRGRCFLGSSVDAGITRIQGLLHSTEDHPLPTSSGRRLSGGDAVYGVWLPLYAKTLWPALDKALQTGLAGDGSILMALADSYLDRDRSGHFTDNSFEVFNAITCLDRDEGVPSSRVARYVPRFQKASPTFGAIFAAGLTTCRVWPVHSGRGPAPVRAVGSPPIMVVGTTRDPATPLVWARALARQLPKGVLVTRDGDGHTGYRQGSTCVDRAVEGYLVAGTVPRRDVSCV